MSSESQPPQADLRPILDRIATADRRRASPRRLVLPPGVYQADRARVVAVRWLALLLGLLVALGAVPAIGFLAPTSSPGWARLVLFVALLQMAYLAWMAVLPDWSTVWVAMIMFATVATLCALSMAVAIATPEGRALPLGLDAVRSKMALWCGASLLLNVLGTYVCGRMSVRWHRSCGRSLRSGRQPIGY